MKLKVFRRNDATVLLLKGWPVQTTFMVLAAFPALLTLCVAFSNSPTAGDALVGLGVLTFLVLLPSLFLGNPRCEIVLEDGSVSIAVHREDLLGEEKAELAGPKEDVTVVLERRERPLLRGLCSVGQALTPAVLDRLPEWTVLLRDGANRAVTVATELPLAKARPLADALGKSLGTTRSARPDDAIPDPLMAALHRRPEFPLKLYLAGGAAVFGLVCLGISTHQDRARRGASAEAVPCDLAALERGEAPGDMHVKLGPHAALYHHAVIKYSTSIGSKPTPKTRLQVCYVPVISKENPFFAELQALAGRHGGIERIPDTDWPQVREFAALRITKRFRRIGDVPPGLSVEDGLEGLVTNRIAPLDSRARKLLAERFPHVDLEKVWMIDEGRRPWSERSVRAMSGLGKLLLVGAALLAVWHLAR